MTISAISNIKMNYLRLRFMKNKIVGFIILLGLGWVFLSATIDLDNLFNYANQDIPDYISHDNTEDNPINDRTATLGRVLFYDKSLSSNGTIACASCHLQERAFSDPNIQSAGVNGLTGRHSMRLVNPRFGREKKFFWDERATTLEEQTTMPIKDHIEMGFSGTNGDLTINDLTAQLEELDYYNTLFEFAYGDTEITENRIQLALAQFIRSIQSFDSRFDEGLVQVANISVPFPNFTLEENNGKELFINTPPEGAGCADCHIPPEFSIHIGSFNNGVITVAGMPGEIDLTNTRAPSLRDLENPDGTLNTPLMHDGSFTSILQVINHYDSIPFHPENNLLDARLLDNNGNPQQLHLTEDQKQALVAFLRTLTSEDMYTNEKWSDPFDPDGSITIIGGTLGISGQNLSPFISISPNPVRTVAQVETSFGEFIVNVFDVSGKMVLRKEGDGSVILNMTDLNSGLYFIRISTSEGKNFTKRIIKR